MRREKGRKKEGGGEKIFCLVFISSQPAVYIEILNFLIPLLVLVTVSPLSSSALPQS